MRQIIKNAVHRIVHTFGLPLHRIAFAWTGDRSTPARDLYPRPPPGIDPHTLFKEPRIVYESLSDMWDTSLFLLACYDPDTFPDPWPRGHSLLLGPNGVSDLSNWSQILTYLRTLIRQFQFCVLQEPSTLCSPASPAPPKDDQRPCDRNQQRGTERLDRCLEALLEIDAYRPHPEDREHQPTQTVADCTSSHRPPPVVGPAHFSKRT